ncbi:MAG: 30S ribosomal protein S4 [Thermodesulfobacteriota bacterium]|nr:30S ribosomal protein S4 [Thermodesulfobacteriota bacterium]
MSRHTGPVCKICRREGTKLYLKGERCFTDKCAMEQRNYPPGQHGQRRSRQSDYRVHLREKQKVRRTYGVSEAQFKRYYEMAKADKGATGENLLLLLERRLDNIVFRMGFAVSRSQARQLISHGHFEVRGKKTDIPSFLVKEGDEIGVREKSKKIVSIADSLELTEQRGVVEWLEVDPKAMKGNMTVLPQRSQMPMAVEETLIVEYYSK